MLLLHEQHTILHTAIEARQLDLVQWLVQPLSSGYLPLSSHVVYQTGGSREDITPKPLPESYCKELFDADGPTALRAAAARGDLELIDRLLPSTGHYPDNERLSVLYPVMRPLMVELREAIGEHDPVLGDVINLRLRHSDIMDLFEHVHSVDRLDEIKARMETDELNFDWWDTQTDDYFPKEADALSHALHMAVGADRIDLVTWLMDVWWAEHVATRSGEDHLCDYMFDSGYRVDVNDMLKPRSVVTDLSKPRYWRDIYSSMMYFDAMMQRWKEGEDFSCSALVQIIKAELAERPFRFSSRRDDSEDDSEKIKVLTTLVNLADTSYAGLPAMLDFLFERGYAPPRLSVVICAGATWALDWLLARNLMSLDDVLTCVWDEEQINTATSPWLMFLTGTLYDQMHEMAPWLAEAARSYEASGRAMCVGVALAALAASQGALAIMEMLEARGRYMSQAMEVSFSQKRNLMHIIAATMDKSPMIWLLGNGYARLLTKRSAKGRSPFHEAVEAGNLEIAYLLLDDDAMPKGQCGDVPRWLSAGHTAGCRAHDRFASWDDLAVASEYDGMRHIGLEYRGRLAVTVTLPDLLRSAAPLDAIEALHASHKAAFGESIGSHSRWGNAYLTRVLAAAVQGARGDFLRWLYGASDLHGSQGITGRVMRIYWPHAIQKILKDLTHAQLCRLLIVDDGGPSSVDLLRVVDELEASTLREQACSERLEALDFALVNLWVDGGSIAEIKFLLSQIGAELALAPPAVTSTRCAVYDMTINHLVELKYSRTSRARVRPFGTSDVDCARRVEFMAGVGVANDECIGYCDLLTACTLNGHAHLVHYLLNECSVRANPTQAAHALAFALAWSCPTNTMQALCTYLGTHNIDLSTIRRDPPDEQTGVLEHALQGLLTVRDYGRHIYNSREVPPDYEERMERAWTNLAWLVANKSIQLSKCALPKMLDSRELKETARWDDRRRPEHFTESEWEQEREDTHTFVLRLTRFCIEDLGTSWSDESDGRTLLQHLIDGGWMGAVAWLARERGAPLQGLIIGGRYSWRNGRSLERLQELQDEQKREWERVATL